jgi:hypothetical protein
MVRVAVTFLAPEEKQEYSKDSDKNSFQKWLVGNLSPGIRNKL